MKMLKFFFVIAVILGFMQSPTAKSLASDAIRGALGNEVTVTATDQATFDRLCPLMDAYFEVDGAGQGVTRKAIGALAAKAAKTTTDPAVTAFLATVPAAVMGGKSAQTRAAKDLVGRECAAHGASLTVG